jgi:hypothetical protein
VIGDDIVVLPHDVIKVIRDIPKSPRLEDDLYTVTMMEPKTGAGVVYDAEGRVCVTHHASQ